MPKLPEWSSKEHLSVFSDMLEIYMREKSLLKAEMKESQIEKHFFRPIFERLGFEYEVQENVDSNTAFPDYAFFKDRKDLSKAHEMKDSSGFYSNAIAVGEVKRWDRELDRFGQDSQDKKKNPTIQIRLYLIDTNKEWGILSNGRRWRLHNRNRPLSDYYEVDLVSLLEDGDTEGFRYFYYFFRRDAFISILDNPPFLEHVLSESENYARSVGETLRENVYRSLRRLAEGYFAWKENHLDVNNQEDLQLVQHNVMRLVYRLLFILYAEGKGLLSDAAYLESDYSLFKLKHEISRKKDEGRPLIQTGSSYWNRLGDLFKLIDKGSAESGIPRQQFFVPPYNGGLFDVQKNPFLEQKKIGDLFLADAIDSLARATVQDGTAGFVDYSTLEIRHLGSIYEGLLEYKIQVAPTRMVAVGKKLTWMRYSQYAESRKKPAKFENFGMEDRAEAGELYLATFKGERKATGSYYTPEPVVKFIVEQTVGKAVKERLESVAKSNKPMREAILGIRVLDPAMGSGHFLVEVIDLLSREFLHAVELDLQSGQLDSEEANHYTLDSVKREIVSHCIYGVDVNELAVELAKVSLWLSTISRDKPLSFLDHRLKCGNSLIGATLSDLKQYPQKQRGKSGSQNNLPSFVSAIFIERLISKIEEIESIEDERLEDVRRKERVFEEFRQLPEYEKTRAVADVYTSIHFGNKVDAIGKKSSKEVYYDLIYSLEYPSNWQSKVGTKWFHEAREIAGQKSFFHWELEFPEVFFEHGKVKEKAGFDVVLGNPPYVSIEKIPKDDLAFFKTRFDSATYGRTDLYLLFMELAEVLRTPEGRSSLIVPDKWLVSDYGEILRRRFLQHNNLQGIWDLRKEKVFPDATNAPVVFVVGPPTEDGRIRFEGGFSHTQLPTLKAALFLGLPKARIKIGLSEKEAEICNKIQKQSTTLGEICYVSYGAQPGRLSNFVFHSANDFERRKTETGHTDLKISDLKPFLRGRNVQRYYIDYGGDLLAYVPDKLHRPAIRELFEKPKTMISEICSTLRATFDENGYYGNEKVVFCVKIGQLQDVAIEIKKDRGIPTLDKKHLEAIDYPDHFLSGLLNSRLMRFHFEKIIGDLLNVYPDDVRELPIKIVKRDHSETSDRLAKSISEAILDPTRRDADVQWKQVEQSSDRDFVIHMVISILAQQMNKLNTHISRESKLFLSWFELWTGSRLDDWSAKTKLARYYEISFPELVEILKQNQNRVTMDLTARDKLEALKGEFDKSVAILKPLENESARLDVIIDRLVYDLYSMSDDEVEVMEESGLQDVGLSTQDDI